MIAVSLWSPQLIELNRSASRLITVNMWQDCFLKVFNIKEGEKEGGQEHILKWKIDFAD